MPTTSSGREANAFALLDTETGRWLDANGSTDLFSEQSPPYLETWPSSGSMRNGRVYAHPTSEHHTPDSESSSSPGPENEHLLRTPVADEAGGGSTTSRRSQEARADAPTHRADPRDDRRPPADTDFHGLQSKRGGESPRRDVDGRGGENRAGHQTEPPPLLPTPVAQPSGNSPADHLRKKPGRTRVTDLSILAENDLIRTGGRIASTPHSEND